MNALTTAFALAKNDLSRQKRRLTVASVLIIVAAVNLLFAIGFAATAVAIWLTNSYGLIVALIITSSSFLALSAVAIIANSVFQRRQRRKLAQSAAIKGAAVANILSVTKGTNLMLPALVAIGGILLARQLNQQEN